MASKPEEGDESIAMVGREVPWPGGTTRAPCAAVLMQCFSADAFGKCSSRPCHFAPFLKKNTKWMIM
jgi:hypothetical protein